MNNKDDFMKDLFNKFDPQAKGQKDADTVRDNIKTAAARGEAKELKEQRAAYKKNARQYVEEHFGEQIDKVLLAMTSGIVDVSEDELKRMRACVITSMYMTPKLTKKLGL